MMIVSKFVYPDLEAVLSAERNLRAAIGEIAQSTRECIFINVSHQPEQTLIVRSESEATGEMIRNVLKMAVPENA
jgi:fructose-1-phosphate kinase PfkB-like protein